MTLIGELRNQQKLLGDISYSYLKRDFRFGLLIFIVRSVQFMELKKMGHQEYKLYTSLDDS